MSYQNYIHARDAAWRILLDCTVTTLPVDLNLICRQLEIGLATYTDAAQYIRNKSLEHIRQHTDGFLILRLFKKPTIFYDETMPPDRIRFTIAHEIGHLVLGHVQNGQVTTINREPLPQDNPHETQANQFAARLLAPACVLWRMQLHKPQDISRICGISLQAATFRAKRMETLHQRNKFLLSSLERAVFQNFINFMEEDERE